MSKLSSSEWSLVAGIGLALVCAMLSPAVSQFANYHGFADQRSWGELPHAMDVLTNVPFALAGCIGLIYTEMMRRTHGFDHRVGLAYVFFFGLLATTVGSAVYHLHPDDASLAWDRCGMVGAFAGLLGMAAADRVSIRAGVTLAGFALLAGPISVLVWRVSGNLVPWALFQGGGMLLIVALTRNEPREGAWRLPLGAVIGWYALAKVMELGDQVVFDLTQGILAGHSLKHVFAACAAIPVLAVMHNAAKSKPHAHKLRRSEIKMTTK